MPAVEISESPRHRHDGGFFSSTCLHSQIPYDFGSSWWWFSAPGMLCCIFLKLSHDDDWVFLEKCCIIWAEFFPDANNTLQSSSIFVGIRFIFCRFDAASWPPDTLLPLASFSFWVVLIQHYGPRSPLTVGILPIFRCFDTASPARTKTGADFCLPASGGADM